MNEEIFRKKNLDKVKSPENLDDYIRVSNPGMWLFLISIIVLLAGACVWGFFGHIDSTVSVSIRSESGETVCYVSDSDIEYVKVGMKVTFDGFDAEIGKIGEKDAAGCVCVLNTGKAVPDGYYDGKIVTDTVKPLSFVLN